MIDSFSTVTLFVVTQDTARIAALLQQTSPPSTKFSIGPFTFTLVANLSSERFLYTVTLGDVSVPVFLLHTDASSWECGPLAYLYFLNYIWQCYELFNFRKFGIIGFP